METVKRLLPAVRREGEMSGQSTGDFQGSENSQHEVIMVDTYHYLYVIRINLSKHTECTPLGGNPSVNCGRWWL